MLQHPIEVLHYVGVCDPHKVETLAFKPKSPTLIVSLLARMRVPVDLNVQLCARAKEIRDEIADPNLTSKLASIELPRSDGQPKPPSGRRCFFTR